MLFKMKQGAVRTLRDVILFVLGVLGIVHETIVIEQERPFLLVLFASMVGLTGIIRGIELDVQKSDQEDNR